MLAPWAGALASYLTALPSLVLSSFTSYNDLSQPHSRIKGQEEASPFPLGYDPQVLQAVFAHILMSATMVSWL